jgi:hypothetical protein
LRGICKQHRHLIAVDSIVDALPDGALDAREVLPEIGPAIPRTIRPPVL